MSQRYELSARAEAVLLRALTAIANNPSAWNQASFASKGKGECGTTGCLAGWICSLEYGMSLDEIADGGIYNPSTLALNALFGHHRGPRLLPDVSTREARDDFADRVFFAFSTEEHYFSGKDEGGFDAFIDYLSDLTGIDFDTDQEVANA